MTSEAWEKAVEAGARAMALVHFGRKFGPGVSVDTTWVVYKDEAALAIRAAFPILAEELVEVVECLDPDGPHIAARLRARIEQLIG